MQCIDSVRGQGYDAWEQIVVDDGSSDSTLALVRRRAGPKIHYVRREHRGIAGLADAYNQALELSNGEIIGILEGDDFWPPRKLEVQIPVFRSADVVLSWGQGSVVDEFGKTKHSLRTFRGSRIRTLHARNLLPLLIFNNALVPSSGVLVRRESLERIGGFQQPNGVPYADWPTWLTIVDNMQDSETFAYIGREVAAWRTHSAQTSNYPVMVAARSSIATNTIAGLSDRLLGVANISRRDLNRIVRYQRSRSLLATGLWAEGRRELEGCMRFDSRPMAVPLAVAQASLTLHLDLFRLLPFSLRYSLPDFVQKMLKF